MLHSLAPGTIVDDRYEVIEHIGTGGMGSVFKVRELGTERILGLKLLNLELTCDDENHKRFKREGKILASLSHPNVIASYRFGVWLNTVPYIVMELLIGKSLREVIDSTGQVSPETCLSIAMQICGAMEYAHEHHIVHRDLKPDNIVIVDDLSGQIVKVVDFGLAKRAGTTGASQHLTQTGALIGSVYYMSPEQCLGKNADGRSDIYSVGCLLYEALTGNPPLVADTAVGIIHKHVHELPQPIDRPLPEGLNNLLLCAMAKDPSTRYQTMAHMKVDIEKILAGHGSEIRAIEDSNRLERKSKTTVLLSICVCFGVVVFLSLLAAGHRTPWSDEALFIRRKDSHRSPISQTLPLTYSEIRFGKSGQPKMIAALRQWLEKFEVHEPKLAARARFWLYIESSSERLDRPLSSTELLLIRLEGDRHRDCETKLFTDARQSLCSLLEHKEEMRLTVHEVDLFVDLRLILTKLEFGCRKYEELIPHLLKEYGASMSMSGRNQLLRELADELTKRGDYQSEEKFRRTILEERDPEDLIWLSRCLFRRKKVQEAGEILDAAMKSASSSSCFIRLNMIHFAALQFLEQGRYAKVLEFDASSCNRDGLSETGPVFLVAKALQRLKRYREAHDLLLGELRGTDLKGPEKFYRQLILLGCMVSNGADGRIPVVEIVEKEVSGYGMEELARCSLEFARTDVVLAAKLAHRSMDLLIAVIDENPTAHVETARLITRAFNSTGHHREAAELARKVLATLTVVPQGQRDFLEAGLRVELGNGLVGIGKADEASQAIAPAIKAFATSSKPDEPAEQLASFLTWNGIYQQASHRFCDSRDSFKKAVDVADRSYGVGPRQKAWILKAYASACEEAGDHRKAKLLRASAEIVLPEMCKEELGFLTDRIPSRELKW